MKSALASSGHSADAARQGLEGSGARGTFSDLAAVPHLPPTASAGRGSRHSGPTLPPGVTIPARADQVAALSPGGGGFVIKAPANPIHVREPWSRAASPSPSSIASVSCSRMGIPSTRSALAMACRRSRRSGAGCRGMMKLRLACDSRARSASSLPGMPPSKRPRRQPVPIPQTRRRPASLSMRNAGGWASSAMHSPIARSWRRQ